MHLSKRGRLIVRLQKDGKQIKGGQLLVDANGKRIGKVIEVIGPVNAPYASVAPLTDRIKKIIGTSVINVPSHLFVKYSTIHLLHYNKK